MKHVGVFCPPNKRPVLFGRITSDTRAIALELPNYHLNELQTSRSYVGHGSSTTPI